MDKLSVLQQPGGAAAGQQGDGGGASGTLLRKAYAYLVQLVGQGLESLMQVRAVRGFGGGGRGAQAQRRPRRRSNCAGGPCAGVSGCRRVAPCRA